MPNSDFTPMARLLFKACSTAEYDEDQWVNAIAEFGETAFNLGRRKDAK